MSFVGMLTETVSIVRNVPTADASSAPVAGWDESANIVYASVPARKEDRYPKLHGDQEIEFGQYVINQAHFFFVEGLYTDLKSGNGYGLVYDSALFRVTNIWRFNAIGNMPAHSIFVCETVGS
jgi:hypothetical protein